MLLLAMAASAARAQTVTDDFAAGVDPGSWTVAETQAGLYSIDDSNGDVRLAKVGTMTGNLQNISLTFDLSPFGGSVSGDFSVEVDFTDAVLGNLSEQVELQTGFAGGGVFHIVYDNSSNPANAVPGLNYHVWDGSAPLKGYTTTGGDAGKLRISRTGQTISAYASGNLVFSKTVTGSLIEVKMVLQNNSGSDNACSVTLDNFSMTVPAATNQAPTIRILGKVRIHTKKPRWTVRCAARNAVQVQISVNRSGFSNVPKRGSIWRRSVDLRNGPNHIVARAIGFTGISPKVARATIVRH